MYESSSHDKAVLKQPPAARVTLLLRQGVLRLAGEVRQPYQSTQVLAATD